MRELDDHETEVPDARLSTTDYHDRDADAAVTDFVASEEPLLLLPG